MADSPRHNSNLLSRAEVVALINTLHRLSESLYYVNSFRKMWAEEDKAGQGKLLEENVDKENVPRVRSIVLLDVKSLM